MTSPCDGYCIVYDSGGLKLHFSDVTAKKTSRETRSMRMLMFTICNACRHDGADGEAPIKGAGRVISALVVRTLPMSLSTSLP